MAENPPPTHRYVLITGGAGYIGSHTVLSVLESAKFDDYKLVVLDNLSNASRGNVGHVCVYICVDVETQNRYAELNNGLEKRWIFI